jgi:hypothetical protein
MLLRVLPSDLASQAIVWLTALAIPLFVALVVWAVALTVRRRPIGLGVVRSILVLAGEMLGYLILGSTGNPTLHLISLSASGILVIGVALSRARTAGAILVAVALPWTVWWGSFLVDNAFAGRHRVLLDVIPPLTAGAAAALAGALLFVAGGDVEGRAHQPPPAEPVGRKFGDTGRAMLGSRIAGMSTHELVSAVALLGVGLATAALAHGRPFLEAAIVVVGGVLVAWALCCTAWVVARRAGDRRAWEAYTWLGEWELDRYRAIVGGPALPTATDFRKWLKASPDRPDLAWIRSELFVMERQFDEARAAAETIPDDTPYGRVERESARASVDWYAGGPGDPMALRTAVDAMPAGSDDVRLRAEVMLAASEVRVRLAGHDPDPTHPMRLVRDRLGSRADGILWTVVRRRLWSKLLVSALVTVLVIVGLDRVTGIG